jgi:lipoprotein NlpD
MNAAESGASPLSGEAPPPLNVTPATPPAPAQREPEKASGTDKEDIDWTWPVKGKVLAPFSEATKGMDIGGRKGAPVLAAASGRVIYADAGVRGYGKLIIIKHNDTWVSAYAHNDNILVKEQQDVRKGQKIAEMGSSDTDQVKLHFEVRRQGKPVDPVKVLPGM